MSAELTQWKRVFFQAERDYRDGKITAQEWERRVRAGDVESDSAEEADSEQG